MKEGHFFEQKGLDASFYRRGVVDVAQDLLGKVLFVRNGGIFCAGRIVETEAYGENDRASHAYGGRRTLRNASMFLAGGHAYVYLCYGLHIMLNVVCEEAGTGAAVLLRALEPCIGEAQMYGRRGKGIRRRDLTSGPGRLSQAMGITMKMNGCSLLTPNVYIAEPTPAKSSVAGEKRVSSARIGIAYAGKDAYRPWRFYLRGNIFVSKP